MVESRAKAASEYRIGCIVPEFNLAYKFGYPTKRREARQVVVPESARPASFLPLSRHLANGLDHPGPASREIVIPIITGVNMVFAG